ncbi:hypothetical protein Tco_0010431 [Tanacetum coccineum]
MPTIFSYNQTLHAMVLVDHTGWKLHRKQWTATTDQLIEDLEAAYDNAPNMFSIRIHHGGKFQRLHREDVRFLDALVRSFKLIEVIDDVMRQLSFDKTELEGEVGFADVTGSGVDSSWLSHDNSFGVDDLDLNLNELEHVFEEEVPLNNNIGKQIGDFVDMPSEAVEQGMDVNVPDEIDGAKGEQVPNHVVKKDNLEFLKCLGNANLHVPLNEIKIDKTLRFVEEPVEIMDREVKSLKRSKRKQLMKFSLEFQSTCLSFTWETRRLYEGLSDPHLFVDRQLNQQLNPRERKFP